jgi:hypothetical protein
MKVFRTLVALGAAALVLSGCGLLNAFVPDQTATNPLGLDGVPVSMTATSTAALAPQAAAPGTDFSGSVSASFPNIDTSGFPSGVTPNKLVADLTLGALVTVSSPSAVGGADFPDAVNVTAAGIDLTVADGSGSPNTTVSASASSASGMLTLTKGSCKAGTVGWSCDYAPSLASGASALLTITVSAHFAQLWTIATAGTSPNTVDGSFGVTLDPGIPGDSTVSVTLSSAEGTFSF